MVGVWKVESIIMYPMKLKPVIKEYLWGGSRLCSEYNMNTDSGIIAEDWAMSCHNDGLSVVENGIFGGRSLKDVVSENPGFLGSSCGKEIELLVKLIDAEKNLSVQVHPNNEYAQKFENDNGKTEMWYVVDCKEDASIFCGFTHSFCESDYSDEEIRKKIADGTITQVLQKHKVRKGDVFFIPPGTVHAINGGVLIAEIQQSSNVTYRLFDYNRTDKDGNKRPLHIEKALDVMQITPFWTQEQNDIQNYDGHRGKYSLRLLKNCEYFDVKELETETEAVLSATSASFQNILFLDGSGEILSQGFSEKFSKGDSFFIPAGLKYKIKGTCRAILTSL